MANVFAPLNMILVHSSLRGLDKIDIFAVYIPHASVFHHPGHHSVVMLAVCEIGKALGGFSPSYVSNVPPSSRVMMEVCSLDWNFWPAHLFPPYSRRLVVAMRRPWVSSLWVTVWRAIVRVVARRDILVPVVVLLGRMKRPCLMRPPRRVPVTLNGRL